MTFAIKAEVGTVRSTAFAFVAQKTMYGGKRVAPGDTIFVFASENERGPGLIARGVVTSVDAVAKKPGLARQTARVSIRVKRTALARRRLGRSELRPFKKWDDGRPETELNFKFYRQATNKIAGISDKAARFLEGFFSQGDRSRGSGRRAAARGVRPGGHRDRRSDTGGDGRRLPAPRLEPSPLSLHHHRRFASRVDSDRRAPDSC